MGLTPTSNILAVEGSVLNMDGSLQNPRSDSNAPVQEEEPDPYPNMVVEVNITAERPRWRGWFAFICACIGSSVGLTNILRFPFYTLKHGGPQFIMAYGIALFAVGIPMLIMELALGQKMQKAAAGSIRSILPRLAGAGWAASFAGFTKCVIDNIVIGLAFNYLLASNEAPWSGKDTPKPLSCMTASAQKTSAEIWLYST